MTDNSDAVSSDLATRSSTLSLTDLRIRMSDNRGCFSNDYRLGANSLSEINESFCPFASNAGASFPRHFLLRHSIRHPWVVRYPHSTTFSSNQQKDFYKLLICYVYWYCHLRHFLCSGRNFAPCHSFMFRCFLYVC